MEITLSSLIVLLGGYSVVIIGVIAWLSRRLAERINIKWQRDRDSAIESLKSTLQLDRDRISVALNTLSKPYPLEITKYIEIIDKLWEYLLEVRDYASDATTFYDIIKPDEYNLVFSRDSIMHMVQDYSHESLGQIMDKGKDIERNRPFLGEVQWALFFVYRGFLLRTCILIIWGLQDMEMINWKTDKGLLQMYNSAFARNKESSISSFEGMNMAMIISSFEQKLMDGFEKILSGQKRAEDNLEIANKMLVAARNSQNKNA